MKLLVLGGTRFLGRHLVGAAVARGHQLTLFNRERSSPGLYPDIEQLRGERDADLKVLRGRSWGAVIDICSSVTQLVRVLRSGKGG